MRTVLPAWDSLFIFHLSSCLVMADMVCWKETEFSFLLKIDWPRHLSNCDKSLNPFACTRALMDGSTLLPKRTTDLS